MFHTFFRHGRAASRDGAASLPSKYIISILEIIFFVNVFASVFPFIFCVQAYCVQVMVIFFFFDHQLKTIYTSSDQKECDNLY
jgi:hypothetical protein